MDKFGLTGEQLLTLAGVGLILFIGLLVAKFILKLTTSFVKLGCLAILVIMLVIFVILLVVPM